ncbi:MAG: PKD domain-containing protein [Anaerolineae bacterium]|nr:PKD domain-containing protein [Anaerolineae bacterium]
MTFIENAGQFAEGARFQARGGNHTLWLADDAIWITVLEPAAPSPAGEPEFPAQTDAIQMEDDTLHGVHIRLTFPGANPQPGLEAFHPLTTTLSYFRGSDPTGWQANVPVWGSVRYANLYPGVDLELSSAGALNLVCHASCATALQNVQLQVEGAENLSLAGDQLQLQTAVGVVTLSLFTVIGPDGRSFQTNTLTPLINGDMVIHPFADDSQSPQNQPLSPTDNPANLLYSTFLGGTDSDVSLDIAVDDAGNTYITGNTYNGTFPTTPGTFDTSFNGVIDAFVVKLGPTGSSLLYGTFLGGDDWDTGVGIAVNENGEAYVTGSTGGGPGFPTTPGAFDRTFNGGNDAFVVKLNSAGNALLYGTYLGGNFNDGPSDIALDEAGNVYLTGSTSFTDYVNFPTTPGAYDTTHNGGNDVFIAKLNPTGNTLVYSTFLGSSGGEGSSGIVVDAVGNATVGGNTVAADFPTTSGAFDTTFNGVRDLFVTRLAADGSALLFSTFLGGVNYDRGGALALGPAGSVYITGMAMSANFPVTPGAFDTSFNSSGESDAFLVQLAQTGSTLLYSTFIGGGSGDEGQVIISDATGHAYITGSTYSSGFPTTPDAFDRSYNDNGGEDVFVVKMNPSIGNGMLYSTYLGGSDDDEGEGIAVDEQGDVYVTGETFSPAFPVTPGAFDTNYDGSRDAYVSKLALGVGPASLTISGPTAILINDTHPFTATVGPVDTTLPLSYTWTTTGQPPVVQIGGLQNVLSFTWPTPGPQTITVTAVNHLGVVTATHTITLYTPVQAGFVATPTTGIAPVTASFTNLSTGDFTDCLWDFGDGSTSDVCADPGHSYTVAGVYTVTLTASGPGNTDTLIRSSYITVYEPVQAEFSASPTEGILPLSVNFTNLSSGDYDTCLWEFGDGLTSQGCLDPGHTYTQTGVYTVTLTVTGWGGTDSLTQSNYISVYEAVQAGFSAGPTTGIAPLSVNFLNLSTGDFDSCLWAFGDGSDSNACNDPAHTYTTAGVYTVTLTVSGPGGTDSLTQTDLITVYEPVTAVFSGTPTSGIAPLTVDFTNLSIGDYDTCLWAFGDGDTSSDCESLGHVYTTPGSYTVALTVTGLGGADTVTQTDYITVYQPVQADFSASPTDGIAPLSTHFTNLATGDYDTCLWTFGDGNSSIDCNDPDHLYTAVGVYTVTLTITGTGGIDSRTQTNYITVYEPVTAQFSASPSSGIAPLMVSFTNLTMGDYDSCLWTFGDGAVSQICQNPTHLYEAPGRYTVTLMVAGPGGTDTAMHNNAITVYEVVQAGFSATPTSGIMPLFVQFTNLSAGDFDSCLWAFGDGRSSNLCTNPTHLYTAPGTYTVSLTVTGAGGSHTVTEVGYVTVQSYRIFLPIIIRAGDE